MPVKKKGSKTTSSKTAHVLNLITTVEDQVEEELDTNLAAQTPPTPPAEKPVPAPEPPSLQAEPPAPPPVLQATPPTAPAPPVAPPEPPQPILQAPPPEVPQAKVEVAMSDDLLASQIQAALASQLMADLKAESRNFNPRMIKGQKMEAEQMDEEEAESEDSDALSLQEEDATTGEEMDAVEESSPEPESVEESTPEPDAVEESSTEPDAVEEPSPEPDAVEEPSPEPESVEESTPEPESVEESTPEPESVEESSPEPESVEESSPEPESVEQSTPEPDAVEEPSPEPDAVEESSPEPDAVEEPSPEPDAVEEPSPEPDAVEEPSPEPESVEESTPEPEAVEESTPEPDAVEEPKPEPDAVEESTPEPDAVEEPTPEPEAVVEPSPEPVAVEESSPEPVAVEESTPQPEAVEESSPEPDAVEESTPEPDAVEESSPEPDAVEEPSPVPDAVEESSPQPVAMEEPKVTPAVFPQVSAEDITEDGEILDAQAEDYAPPSFTGDDISLPPPPELPPRKTGTAPSPAKKEAPVMPPMPTVEDLKPLTSGKKPPIPPEDILDMIDSKAFDLHNEECALSSKIQGALDEHLNEEEEEAVVQSPPSIFLDPILPPEATNPSSISLAPSAPMELGSMPERPLDLMPQQATELLELSPHGLEESDAIRTIDVSDHQNPMVGRRLGEPVEYYNLTEILVRDLAPGSLQTFGTCTCDQCLLDVIAHCLSRLPPKYVVRFHGGYDQIYEDYKQEYGSAIVSQLGKSCIFVNESPRHLKAFMTD